MTNENIASSIADRVAFIKQRQIEIDAFKVRANDISKLAAVAYERLLRMAEDEMSTHTNRGRVINFLASSYNSTVYPYNLWELGGLDIEISEDIALCIDAIRISSVGLHELARNGRARVLSILKKNFSPPTFSAGH